MAGEAAAAVAAEHQARQNAIRLSQIAAIVAAFRELDEADPIGSWTRGIGERIYVLISVGQELFASEARAYVARALAASGIVATLPDINARSFAGIASDGRNLESLLAGAAIRVTSRLRRGQSRAEAMRSGEMWLRMVADTQMADAARAADSAAIVALRDARQYRRADRARRLRDALATTTLSPEREADIARRLQEAGGGDDPAADANSNPQVEGEGSEPAGRPVAVGYVRMLTPPSCARCVVLAGRWYRWSAGFERHPMCDCRHIPAAESIAGDITTDADAYFASLSPQDQDRYFGKADAEAIRQGASISQVVNAHREGAMFTADDGRRYTSESTTRRGRGRVRRAGGPVLRPTVWQIYRDADGDRDAARQMLAEFGYIL